MARPKTMSEPMTIRIPLELWPTLLENAEAEGLTPSEWVKFIIINDLLPDDPTECVRRFTIDSIVGDYAHQGNSMIETLTEPTDEEMAHSQAFCPDVEPEEIDVEYTVISKNPVFGPHLSWRMNTIGMNVCTACGEPEGSARKLCTGNPL